MKSFQKWFTEHTSDVDETSWLGSNHRDNVRLPGNELPSFKVSIKIGKHSLVYLMELCTLPKVQKLYYLKGALKGEAKRVLSDLPTTGANYDAAIQLLKD